MKKFFRIFILFILVLIVVPLGISTVYAENVEDDRLFLGGYAAGFSFNTRGAFVLGTCDVVTEDSVKSPSKNADLRAGDIILSIDGNDVNNASDISNAIKDGDEKTVIVKRQNDKIIKNMFPAKDMTGEYKLGVFIREGINGIGTISFIKGNKIAALGHPVTDENGNVADITGGEMFNCKITSVVKGIRGRAGELHGVFIKTEKIADINENTVSGIYGTISEKYDKNDLTPIEQGQAVMGNASIYCTVDDGAPQAYDISIIKIDRPEREDRNLVIKITDERLLSITGGIVQGMSGSPIVQNGKLVGAVTHVFINDPTRGFGITINNMLNKL